MQTPGLAHGRSAKPLPAEGWLCRKASPARPHKDAAAPCQALDHRGDPFSVVPEGVLAHAQPTEPRDPAQAHGPLCSRKETPIEGPPVGRGSAPPLAARPGVASQAGAHVVIPRVDCGQPCSARLRNWAFASAGASQERVLRSVLSYSRLSRFEVNPPVQRASDVGWGDFHVLYSHKEVSAAENWLVTTHHQNCDSKSTWLLFQYSLSP